MYWKIRQMGRRGGISWESLKEDLREFLVPANYSPLEEFLKKMEHESSKLVEAPMVGDSDIAGDDGEEADTVIEDAHTHLVEESLDEGVRLKIISLQ